MATRSGLNCGPDGATVDRAARRAKLRKPLGYQPTTSMGQAASTIATCGTGTIGILPPVLLEIARHYRVSELFRGSSHEVLVGNLANRIFLILDFLNDAAKRLRHRPAITSYRDNIA